MGGRGVWYPIATPDLQADAREYALHQLELGNLGGQRMIENNTRRGWQQRKYQVRVERGEGN